MNSSPDSVLWDTTSAAPFIAVPSASDTKYSRGVLGLVTGSKRYPGAAVLSVEAAHRTGIGMVRFHGPRRVADHVLSRRPEAVTAAGRVQAWLVGSGMDATSRTHQEHVRLQMAFSSGCPLVVDAGALDLVASASGPVVITPHARELATLLLAKGTSSAETFTVVDELAAEIAAQPERWVLLAADELAVTVLLKGHVTHVATPNGAVPRDDRGTRFHARIVSPTTWLATAGTGDVLAGILGALVATHADQVLENPAFLGPLAATAALLHGVAAERASHGGPIAAFDVAEALPLAIAGILYSR